MSGNSFTIGNTTVGTDQDTNDPNAQYISYFIANSSGQITDILAYIAGISPGSAIAALYATSGGIAAALLAQSSPVSIGTSFSWVDFPLPTPVNITSGITYGIALMGTVSIQVALVPGSGARAYGSGSYAAGFANPFGTVWWSNTDAGAMSIYASGATPPSPPPSSILTIMVTTL